MLRIKFETFWEEGDLASNNILRLDYPNLIYNKFLFILAGKDGWMDGYKICIMDWLWQLKEKNYDTGPVTTCCCVLTLLCILNK